MRILCLGDVVGTSAVEKLSRELSGHISRLKIDFTVINGENACMGKGNGISPEYAQTLFMAGADVITGGNHSFGNRSIYSMLEDCDTILRPNNYPSMCPGKGYTIVNSCGYRFLVINVQGRVFMMDEIDCPFASVDRVLEYNKGKYDYSIMDIHAETTSEKIAIASYFDGKVDMMFGTHTHVATADERILPKGSGYITDVGMCGPINSSLGVKTEVIIEKLRSGMPAKFELSDNPIELQGVIFTIEKDRVTDVSRIVLK
jgi:metallophosphoesterase (TIGR00282 family)